MSTRLVRTLLWISIPIAVVLVAALVFDITTRASLEPHLRQRIADLTDMHNALEAHKKARGTYPQSDEGKWSGIHNAFGPASADWIPGLAPRYIKALPRDPRKSENGQFQYLYKSDGKDFKLLAFYPESDCAYVTRNRPELLDPVRGGKGPNPPFPCHAYGFWSAGAASW